MLTLFHSSYTAISLVRNIVHEKEKRLKEAMRMMGLDNWVHWTAWFLKSIVFLLCSIVIMTVLISLFDVFRLSEPVLIFLFLFLFSCSVICFCFMISTLFSKANNASSAGGLIYFLFYVPYFFIEPEKLPGSEKRAACLLFPTCVGIGTDLLSRLEASGKGLTSSTVGDSPTLNYEFTMGDVYGMLVLDCIIYLILTWYGLMRRVRLLGLWRELREPILSSPIVSGSSSRVFVLL